MPDKTEWAPPQKAWAESRKYIAVIMDCLPKDYTAFNKLIVSILAFNVNRLSEALK
jgi:hypothetical protein